MPLPDLILTLLSFRKGAVNSELRQFAKAVHGQDALRPVTPSAFCQARRRQGDGTKVFPAPRR
jgi:hypothetical protein